MMKVNLPVFMSWSSDKLTGCGGNGGKNADATGELGTALQHLRIPWTW